MDVDGAATDKCPMCWEEFAGMAAAEITTLPCSHRMCEECIKDGVRVAGVDRGSFRCPVCRLSANALLDQERSLFGGVIVNPMDGGAVDDDSDDDDADGGAVVDLSLIHI